jgi:acid stress chaperone HdeB
VSAMTIATKALCCAAVAAAVLIASAPVKAQVILEMSALTCKNYLEAPPDRQELIAAWMSGYFNAERKMPTVDFGRFATNKKQVGKYCRGHRNANLMRAIRTAAF